MKPPLKKIISFTLVLTVLLAVTPLVPTALAQSFRIGDFSYRQMDNNSVQITGYHGNAAHLTIPGTVDGFIGNVLQPNHFRVTGIGGDVFAESTTLVTVTVPDSVEHIGVRAFRRATSLTDVILGSGVRWIEFEAFNGCASEQ